MACSKFVCSAYSVFGVVEEPCVPVCLCACVCACVSVSVSVSVSVRAHVLFVNWDQHFQAMPFLHGCLLFHRQSIQGWMQQTRTTCTS